MDQPTDLDGVSFERGRTFLEYWINPIGLRSIVGRLQQDVKIEVPPLISTSFLKLADADWFMKVRHRQVHTIKGLVLRKAQVRFFTKGGIGFTLRLDRRALYHTIWEVVDDLENSKLMLGAKIYTLPSGTFEAPETAVSPQNVLAEELPKFDELAMLRYFNEQRLADLDKDRRKFPPPDLSNVIDIDEYLRAREQEVTPDPEIDERLAKVMGGI